MFDKKWFLKHQKKLLWLLNTPLIRIWFRWVLRINGKRSSVGKNKIIKILPNAIFWEGKKKNKYVAEFRTHNKFSKRLFYAFYPIWYLIHLWDTLIANNFQPAWNLGFDTLTFYPDPHPETTTVDGYVWRGESISESFSEIRSGTGQGSDDSSALSNGVGVASTTTTNLYKGLYRAIYLFDTSSIPDSATITVANLSLWITSIFNDWTEEPDANKKFLIVSSNPASNTALVATDYAISNFGSTAFSEFLGFTSITLGQYNSLIFNSSGLQAISKTGVTKLGLMIYHDFANTAPTWGFNRRFQINGIYYADQTGTSQDPKLVVNFIFGGSFLFNFI